jgi:hypothetical protein
MRSLREQVSIRGVIDEITTLQPFLILRPVWQDSWLPREALLSVFPEDPAGSSAERFPGGAVFQ